MPNHLISSKSLYLQKHAENPINWWYWCDEALSIAKSSNKPIFLSIGYSSCHWCTVMEGEAFSDLSIASYLNENFLPIKVDREERPDLDSIYMQALQMMTGHGGWPLNIFLTPSGLIPFFAGTYFPVEPRFGRPGFLQVLQSIRRFYDTEKDKLDAFKEEIFRHLQESTIIPPVESDKINLVSLISGIDISYKIIGNPNYGGPCFPMIPYALMALEGTRLDLSFVNEIKLSCFNRGKNLALGGIFDAVAGGFHRYTVDSTWTVPHFEKMLYDNGQILEYLANLSSGGFEEPAFQRAIALTVSWLQREMTAPQGYFYAAQDADSFTSADDPEPEEGAFYVWSYSDLEILLSDEEILELQKHFTISSDGNFVDEASPSGEGKNVLQRREEGELPHSVELILSKLFAVRYGDKPEEIKTFPPAKNNQEAKTTPWAGRIPAVTDTKMIVAWNSLMISGLARAFGVFGVKSYWDLATSAANFILENQWVNGRFYRLNYDGVASVLAMSEDYALFIKALLDLQSNSPADTTWLEWAIKIQKEFDEYFWSVELGGYYNNSSDNSEDLLIRERGYIDNATPSANGVAISNLVRLGLLTENEEYLERAEVGLKAFSSIIDKSPQACPSLFTALDWYLNGTSVKTSLSQLDSLIPKYFPTCVYLVESDLPDNVVGFVCKNLNCLTPAETEAELLAQIREN